MEHLFNARTNLSSKQVARIRFPPPGVQAMPTPVTTMTFDNSQELLWTGNDYVRAVSLNILTETRLMFIAVTGSSYFFLRYRTPTIYFLQGACILRWTRSSNTC